MRRRVAAGSGMLPIARGPTMRKRSSSQKSQKLTVKTKGAQERVTIGMDLEVARDSGVVFICSRKRRQMPRDQSRVLAGTVVYSDCYEMAACSRDNALAGIQELTRFAA
jgi:hypothetical protein